MGDLQSGMGTLQSEMGNLQSGMGDLQSGMGTLQSRMGTLQNEQITRESSISVDKQRKAYSWTDFPSRTEKTNINCPYSWCRMRGFNLIFFYGTP